jgi:hypothetical protein
MGVGLADEQHMHFRDVRRSRFSRPTSLFVRALIIDLTMSLRSDSAFRYHMPRGDFTIGGQRLMPYHTRIVEIPALSLDAFPPTPSYNHACIRGTDMRSVYSRS